MFCTILRRGIAKQLFAAGDFSIAVTIQYQERIVGSRSSPSDLDRMTIAANVERNPIGRGSQMEALALSVDDDGAGVTTGLQRGGAIPPAEELITPADTAAARSITRLPSALPEYLLLRCHVAL